MIQNQFQDSRSNAKVDSLVEKVMTAELYFSRYASQYHQTNDEYRQSLMAFIAAWYTLKASRHPQEFIPEYSR